MSLLTRFLCDTSIAEINGNWKFPHYRRGIALGTLFFIKISLNWSVYPSQLFARIFMTPQLSYGYCYFFAQEFVLRIKNEEFTLSHDYFSGILFCAQ